MPYNTKEKQRQHNRDYRLTHKKEHVEESHRYRLAHPEQCREQRRRWGMAHREQARETSYRWIRDNPEKYKARLILKRAVKIGVIKRPVNCTICFRETLIDGHHEDYNKALEVIWVCHRCHKLFHKTT